MSPLELVATPDASPRWMLSGSVSGSTASKAISGMDSCADSTTAEKATPDASAAASIGSRDRERFMEASNLSLSFGRGLRDRLLQADLLHAPGRDLRDDQLIRVAAIHAVDG